MLLLGIDFDKIVFGSLPVSLWFNIETLFVTNVIHITLCMAHQLILGLHNNSWSRHWMSPKFEIFWIVGGRTVPVRIRLSGCYLHYKADGSQISRLELQHKTCSDSKAASDGFEGVREGAFAAVVRGVMGGNGFCDMSYESMHVTAQCQGNLESCDCGECVANAVQIAQDECGESISGEVYLDSCFMTYSYDGINEIPGNSNGGTYQWVAVLFILFGSSSLSPDQDMTLIGHW